MKKQNSKAAAAVRPLAAHEFAIKELAKFRRRAQSTIVVADDGTVTMTIVFDLVNPAHLVKGAGAELPWPGGVFDSRLSNHFKGGSVKNLRLGTTSTKVLLQTDTAGEDIDFETNGEKRESGIGLLAERSSKRRASKPGAAKKAASKKGSLRKGASKKAASKR